MRGRHFRWVGIVAVTAAALMLGAGSARAAYMAGFTWDRSDDYDAGMIPGSTVGNPSTDVEGSGVWRMESTDVAGDGLGGANPWYEGATMVHVWDDSWYSGPGAWTRGDNVNPPIRGGDMTMNISNVGLRANAPLIRWISPVGAPIDVDITGTWTVEWRGGGGESGNIDIDAVIAHVDVSAGVTSVLHSLVFEKPTDDTSLETLSAPVSLLGVRLEPGDQVIISGRGQGFAPSTWPNLVDDLTFSIENVVPEPATLALLGLAAAGLGAYARRRRGCSH